MKTVNQTKELRKMRILHCPEDCVQSYSKRRISQLYIFLVLNKNK